MKAPNQNYGLEHIELQLAMHQHSPLQFGFDLTEEYLEKVSGAKTIYSTEKDETNFDLCVKAAKKLISARPDLPSRLDAILVVTLPTEAIVAPLSARLQGVLAAPQNTFCLDLSLSCVGFLQTASVALDMMSNRQWKNVLVVNIQTQTKIVRPQDHTCRLLLSDSATACLFSDQPRLVFEQFDFFSDGSLAEILETRDGHLFMDGPRVYETVVRRIPASVRTSLEKFGLRREDVDLFLFHQASKRVLDKLIEDLELDPARVPVSIHEVGNLGNSSLPHLLSRLLSEPQNEKTRIFATAFGAGFQWAHAALKMKD